MFSLEANTLCVYSCKNTRSQNIYKARRHTQGVWSSLLRIDHSSRLPLILRSRGFFFECRRGKGLNLSMRVYSADPSAVAVRITPSSLEMSTGFYGSRFVSSDVWCSNTTEESKLRRRKKKSDFMKYRN